MKVFDNTTKRFSRYINQSLRLEHKATQLNRSYFQALLGYSPTLDMAEAKTFKSAAIANQLTVCAN
jgi:hypothetical protein